MSLLIGLYLHLVTWSKAVDCGKSAEKWLIALKFNKKYATDRFSFLATIRKGVHFPIR